jgi:hypothetical protein
MLLMVSLIASANRLRLITNLERSRVQNVAPENIISQRLELRLEDQYGNMVTYDEKQAKTKVELWYNNRCVSTIDELYSSSNARLRPVLDGEVMHKNGILMYVTINILTASASSSVASSIM